MASAQQIAPDQNALNASSPAHNGERRSYVRFFLFACILPLIGFVSAFPLVCSRSYESWGETQWGPELEFPFAPGAPDADVVVFGDSSAFLGIDPRLVNAELGIRSVVLPSTVGSLPVIGDTPLRAYLAHHKQPRLVVLYFSPWNLDFSRTAKGRNFEGEEMMLRHASLGEIVRYELQHPIQFFAFPIRLYSTFSSKMVTAILHHKDRTKEIAAALGHTPYVEKFGTLTDLCRLPSDILDQRKDETVRELRQRYERPGTQVMVYLAPVPRCTNVRSLQVPSMAALQAAPPALLPPTDFAGDPYYAHVLPHAVPESSHVFAQALEQKLKQIAPELLHLHPPSALDAGSPLGKER